MKLAWQCLFSPRLYKIYRDGPLESMYQPNVLERWGDRVVSMASTIMHIGFYSSPFLGMYFYRRGLFSLEESRGYARLISGVTCLIAVSFVIRAVGRSYNPKYTAFLKILMTPITDQKAYLSALRNYDFEFSAWPVSYAMAAGGRSSWLENPFTKCANNDLPVYQRGILQALAFVATHTFGLRLIYPGSLSLIHNILWIPLVQGRTSLVEMFDGQRTKIATSDGNHLDTMFVDNRGNSVKGNTLVVCCEGNSGFYEIGVLLIPIKAGYSALGWNRPGFAESTGSPYPHQEHNAIDAVMQYGINELGFEPENIVMFGWSIGGYSAAWAATKYPVQALILDATFDDLLPLAQNQMPSSWRLLVKEVVRSHVDLDVASLVARYEGPVRLVRRTDDEIICLRSGELSSNRGNHLVQRLIEHRHPEATGATAPLDKMLAMLESQRAALERSATSEADRRVLGLIKQYMRDYKSSHCTPLPEQMFSEMMASVAKKK